MFFKINEFESESGNISREEQREKEREPRGDSIPRLQDHDLSQRQMLNQLSHSGAHHERLLTLGIKLRVAGEEMG